MIVTKMTGRNYLHSPIAEVTSGDVMLGAKCVGLLKNSFGALDRALRWMLRKSNKRCMMWEQGSAAALFVFRAHVKQGPLCWYSSMVER